jgi:hypothetical protein
MQLKSPRKSATGVYCFGCKKDLFLALCHFKFVYQTLNPGGVKHESHTAARPLIEISGFFVSNKIDFDILIV